MAIKKYNTQKGVRYEFTEYIGINPITGKRIVIHRRGFKTNKEAQSKINQLKYEFDHGIIEQSSSDTFEKVYEQWLPLYEKTVKESTLNRTISAFNLHILPEVGSYRISKITPIQCQKLAQDIAKTNKNYRKNYGYAAMVYDYAIKIGLVNTTNPFRRIIYPKNDTTAKPTPFMDKDELAILLNCIKETGNAEMFVFFRLLAYSGMRRGEALALTWDDIDFKELTVCINKTVTVGLKGRLYIATPKTKAGNRTIIIDPETGRILKKYYTLQKVINIGRLVFPNTKGGIMALSKPLKFLNTVIKKNNLKKITVHSFRHTHCAMLFSAGVSIKAAQERLGHDDYKTTMDIYNHVMDKDRRESVQKFLEYMEG